MSAFAKDINVPTNDLIRRQDAIDEIQMLLEQSEDDEHDKTWNNAIRGAANAVKHHTKSAQPEIIHCKDCKWSYDAIGGTFCSHGCCVDCEVDIDFFCADGERKEDNEDIVFGYDNISDDDDYDDWFCADGEMR